MNFLKISRTSATPAKSRDLFSGRDQGQIANPLSCLVSRRFFLVYVEKTFVRQAFCCIPFTLPTNAAEVSHYKEAAD